MMTDSLFADGAPGSRVMASPSIDARFGGDVIGRCLSHREPAR
jgi:hypothetical protein